MSFKISSCFWGWLNCYLLILIFSNNSGQNFSTTFKCCIIKAELNDLFLTEYDEKLHERPLREEDRMEGIK